MTNKYQKLDLSGWIVLHNLIAVGDDIMIRHDGINNLFDRDVHAIVRGISTNNLVRIEILTDGVCGQSGHPWDKKPEFWLDIAHDISVLVAPLTDTEIDLYRIDGKDWMMQGPFRIRLEKETKDYYFGELLNEGHTHRVWPKSEWGVK